MGWGTATLSLPLALFTDRHGIVVKGSARPATLTEQRSSIVREVTVGV